MTHKPLACDRELLRQSLDDRLSERQEEQLAGHLAECPDCRQELERLAGGQEDWSKVSAALKREADSTTSAAQCRLERIPDQHDEAAESATDFAVDFLEPSRRCRSPGPPGRHRRSGDNRPGRDGGGVQRLHRELQPLRGDQGARAAVGRQQHGAQAFPAKPRPPPPWATINRDPSTPWRRARLPYIVMQYVAGVSLSRSHRPQRPAWT